MAKNSDKAKTRAICSFCGRAAGTADAFIEGPNDVFICPECVDLCHNIIRQDKKRLSRPKFTLTELSKPRWIKDHLDEYVIGQDNAKKYF